MVGSSFGFENIFHVIQVSRIVNADNDAISLRSNEGGNRATSTPESRSLSIPAKEIRSASADPTAKLAIRTGACQTLVTGV